MTAALWETGYMVAVSLAAAALIGLPLGMTVFLTQRGGLAENRAAWSIANLYINVVRSFPFLLLVVVLIPFTRAVMGTSFEIGRASCREREESAVCAGEKEGKRERSRQIR